MKLRIRTKEVFVYHKHKNIYEINISSFDTSRWEKVLSLKTFIKHIPLHARNLIAFIRLNEYLVQRFLMKFFIDIISR